MAGGMCGKGGMCGGGACMTGGHVWQGACMVVVGVVHGRGACVSPADTM